MSSTTSGSPPVAAPRLSIVVPPFTNLSDDREQQYFADGITEDLTTDLSQLAGLFVISRNRAFTYRGKPIATQTPAICSPCKTRGYEPDRGYRPSSEPSASVRTIPPSFCATCKLGASALIANGRGDRLVREDSQRCRAHALNGDTERAAAELAGARRLSADDRYTSVTRLKAARYWGVPKAGALSEATYFAGLRKAGMPQE